MVATEAVFVEDEAKTRKLIEELSKEASEGRFESYRQLQHELLHRIDQEKAEFKDEKERETYLQQEDSVFDRVEQHKANQENGMDVFSEKFQEVHGIDHKTFTESWYLENTGHEIQLEKVIENPTFADFVGVFDIKPLTAYIASKMIIEEDDFMGAFRVCTTAKAKDTKNTYEGVHQEHLESHEPALMKEEDEIRQKVANQEHHEDTDGIDGEEAEPSSCCGSDKQLQPHVLGSGKYLQFSLRRKNVIEYLNNSVTANKLKSLIPAVDDEPIYIFTVSSNGVMRFHPWGGISRKLWHGYGDSASTYNFGKNIAHAGKFGCFCFGVIYKEKENYRVTKGKSAGKVKKGGRTIVMRYNRWATDNAPIYAMVRERADHQDPRKAKEQPAQTALQRFLTPIVTCCASLRSKEE